MLSIRMSLHLVEEALSLMKTVRPPLTFWPVRSGHLQDVKFREKGSILSFMARLSSLPIHFPKERNIRVVTRGARASTLHRCNAVLQGRGSTQDASHHSAPH